MMTAAFIGGFFGALAGGYLGTVMVRVFAK